MSHITIGLLVATLLVAAEPARSTDHAEEASITNSQEENLAFVDEVVVVEQRNVSQLRRTTTK